MPKLMLTGLMSDRARLSKLETYTFSNGANFFGSKDFPCALVSSVEKWDPKGSLFGLSDVNLSPSKSEQNHLRELLDSKIQGKKILVCSGGDDKVVPYRCAEQFLQFLKNATRGWYSAGNVSVEDILYPGVGHECTDSMVKDTTRFIRDVLGAVGEAKLPSKI